MGNFTEEPVSVEDDEYCKECHIAAPTYGDLCCTCYFGDNIGTACYPGECEFPGCENNPYTGS